MGFTLTKSQIIKISLILSILIIVLPIFLFNGTLDDFLPIHIAEITKLSQDGKLTDNDYLAAQIPGFYCLGSTISLICGLSPEQLMILPIQIVPYAIILFLILYYLSKNFFIA